MAKHRSLALALVILTLSPAIAAAQGPDEPDDEAAVEPVEVEAVDLTFGMRTDIPVTAAVSSDGALYIGTLQGRIYRSDDRRDFDELTVLPQVKGLWGFSFQTTLLGHIRNDNPVEAQSVDLNPLIGTRQIAGSMTAPLPGEFGTEPIGLAGRADIRYRRSGEFFNQLAAPAERALSGGGAAASVGLSDRAPRLSLLQLALRRPTATINLGKYLRGRARRTRVGRIAIDPNNPKHLFAATKYGLYESRDRGESFARVFPGITKTETDTREIIYDPHDSKRLFLGTARGLFVSDDNGLSFAKHGFVPEVGINKVALDPVDKRYIYVATTSGMYRSNDGGETFSLAFYSSLRKQRTLYWVEIDRNDPERVYLGTADGVFTSGRARTVGSTDWTALAGLRTLNLSMPTVTTCKGRPGLIYAQSSAALPTNIYFGNSPEAYLLVSRDGGETWKVHASNRGQGTINWFEVDKKNCDRVWVLFSNALIELAPREPFGPRRRVRRAPELPPMSEVIRAALEFQGTELSGYAKRLKRLESANWLPRRLNVTASWSSITVGSVTDDFQFAEQRTLAIERLAEFRLMAWATWDLPGLYYEQQTIPLLRARVQLMNDALRKRAVATVTRHYRELVELRTRRLSGADRGRSLSARAAARVLEDQHLAVVDLATGGFVSRYIERRKK